MTKKEVQKRVLQGGKPIALSKFSWDDKTKTFATNECGLVLDFRGIDGCTFKTGDSCTFDTGSYCTFTTFSYCTFKTGSDCTFKTGANCTFTTGYNCTFDTGSNCTFTTGTDCTFDTGYNCTFKTGDSCTFKTGSDCTFKTGSKCTFTTLSNCTFKTLYNCTFTTFYNCTFDTGGSCVVVRRDVFEVLTLSSQEITLAPARIKGYLENGVYSETHKPSIIADNILSEIITERIQRGIAIRKVIVHGQENESYLVERDGVYSHGKTVKEAVESLKYKISNRDKSEYETHTLDTSLTQDEAIRMYRVITGACEAGTRQFVESLDNPPKSLTVKELIELTKNQYGNDVLQKFISKGE